jgi:hypothetical protein
LYGQNKRDYVWITGHNSEPTAGLETYSLNFNESPFEVKHINAGLEYTQNNASICDYDGNLLFYSNGCAVANREHQIMPNGRDINEGEWFDIFWGGDCSNGYPGTQNILALPDPGNINGYYLITTPRIHDVNGPTFIRDIQYSYIDMTLDGGLGDVTTKNEVFYNEKKILGNYLTAVQHANGRDWWIVQPTQDSNQYLKFLIDPLGIHLYDDQFLGCNFHWNASAAGTARFSPDGNKYAYFNGFDQLKLFDFDRSTGQLSNLQEIFIDSLNNFSAIEFSPNGRFLYFSMIEKLFQLDFQKLESPNALVLIDEWNGAQDPFPTIFYLMQRGPDCRIYMCSTSSTNTYHIINNPDEKGEACNFVQQGLSLPYISATANFPHFPNFRIDEEEVCDPTISSVFNIPVAIQSSLDIYPNPVDGIIHINSSIGFESIKIIQLDGRLVIDREFQQNIDVSHLDNGMYVIQFIRNGRVQASKKFIKH